jgi:hypothetical protein
MATRSTWHETGLYGGLTAGVVFLIAASAIAVWKGAAPFGVVRFCGSLALGPAALAPAYPLPRALAAGVATDLLLAMVFGLVAAGLLAATGRTAGAAWRLLAAGAAYGVLLWAINVLVVGPLLFPQATVAASALSAPTHAVGYGLILAGMFSLRRPTPG